MTAGCSYQPPMQRAELEHGYVMLLTGVESYGSYHKDFVRGLRDGGVDRAIDIVEWGYHPFGTFKNLRNYPANRDIAAQIGQKIVQYAADYPGRPIIVVGYSGGGAMALWLAESLPADVLIDRIILTAPAISPGYDVGPALAHTRSGIINFYSPDDWFMSGTATETWGTMDRLYSPTAGRFGFQDEQGNLLVRDGLTQISWIPAWHRLGHAGGHSGWRSRAWACEVMAPLLR